MAESDLRLPGPGDTVVLAVAVVAISASAPLIVAITAPALAIAFWRSLLGGVITAPVVLAGGIDRLRSRPARQWQQAALSGVLLAAHFAAWVPSLRFTSVASSTALVATQPVWAAVIARFRGVRIAAGTWVGIAIALVGVVVLTGIDFSLDPRSLIGDGLALVGAILAAAYVTVGESARQSMSTADYTAVAYLVSAAALLPACLVLGAPLLGYPARDWLLIVALTLVAQLLGHTLVSYVLRRASATVVSLAILFEMPGAVLLAAAFLGQVPPVQVLPALALLAVGLVVVIRSARAVDPVETPPV